MQANDVNLVVGTATMLNAAVTFGTDFFFAFVGKRALSRSDEASMLNVAGNMHEVADRRMPIVGGAAILGTLYLVWANGPASRALYLIALAAMLTHLLLFLLVAKPVNLQMREAVKYGRLLGNARALQERWDSVIVFRAMALMTALVCLLWGFRS